MEDIFKPQSLTIKALFGNQDSLYQIPRYQRPYSWGDEQIEKLWDDLQEARHNNESNYFLGSIITAKPQDKSAYMDIVDGQQRITTLLILLCVCRDLYPNLNSNLLDSDPFAIDSNIIKSSIVYNDRLDRLRLVTHPSHSSDFREFVLNSGAATNNTRPYKKELKREEQPVYKFRNTSAFFTEKLDELGEQEAGLFINYLFNNVKIIRIDCQSVGFAIKLFQVLNDRGLDLSNADLIKSFLIGQIHKKYGEDPEQLKHKEDEFISDWSRCEVIATDTDENLNNLFTLYEYYLLAKNPIKSLYDELEGLFISKDPNEVISDFKNFISLYKTDVCNRKDWVMYSLYYLRWSMYWRTIVLTALHTEYPEYENFLKVLHRYYYLNWIAGHTLTKIKQTSFNIISWIKERKPLAEIMNELEANMHSSSAIKYATENLNDDDIYNQPWCKPLLFIIEYNHIDNPTFLDISDRNIQVEHIIPRAYAKKAEWDYYKNIEAIKSWINSGANLTLLSGSKNLAASNDGFDKKIIAYDGTGNHDATDTKITSFRITQKIVNDYNSGRFSKAWNVDAVNDRWQWFCGQVEKIFNIDLSANKENKL